jgi:hypothetical protein
MTVRISLAFVNVHIRANLGFALCAKPQMP